MTDTRLEGKDLAVTMRALSRTAMRVSPYCLGILVSGRADGPNR